MEGVTSIQVSKRSKEAWRKMKNHPQESFEDMINRVLGILHEDDSELLTEADILEIKRSLQDVRSGGYVTHEKLKKKYGL